MVMVEETNGGVTSPLNLKLDIGILFIIMSCDAKKSAVPDTVIPEERGSTATTGPSDVERTRAELKNPPKNAAKHPTNLDVSMGDTVYLQASARYQPMLCTICSYFVDLSWSLLGWALHPSIFVRSASRVEKATQYGRYFSNGGVNQSSCFPIGSRIPVAC